MSWSIDDLSELEIAIKEGVYLVKYADKEVRYHSIAEMLKLRNLMKQELGLTQYGSYAVSGVKKL